MRKFIEKGRASVVFRVLLLLWDAVTLNLCSYAALLLRFEMSWSRIEVECLEAVNQLLWFNTIVTIAIFFYFRLYHSLWRFAGVKEMVSIVLACLVAVNVHMVSIFHVYRSFSKSYFIIYFFLLLTVTFVIRFSYRLTRHFYSLNIHGAHSHNTMIIGAGEACNMVMKELNMSRYLDSRIRCVIDDNRAKHNSYIQGVRVVGGRDKILESVKRYDVNEIIIAMPSAPRRTIREMLEICQQTDADLKILPGVYQLVTGEATIEKIRKVEIEDLLGREAVQTDLDAVMDYVKNKTILVTGGGGSIGSELCRQIAANHPEKLIIFDIYENNAYDIQQELKMEYPKLSLEVLVGSVRNTERMNSVFSKYRPHIVYHAAAHKHVPLMEDSPNEAIKNNVFGTYKTAVAADRYKVEKFVLISTDKAVNPTNIMGASKRICEMVVQSFNKRSQTEFVAVRFGNVLESNGSVIPLFRKQILAGGPVTVTHPDIIRYFMTIKEAVSLVLQAGALAKGGEIFVLDMGEPVRIYDLAKKLIRLSGYVLDVDVKIQITGLRPGEKLYEEMLMDEEGLLGTENELIHIGKPLEFDEKDFFEKLEKLYEYAYDETDRMKALVSELVPTYQIKDEDIERDEEMRKGQFPELHDHERRKGLGNLVKAAGIFED